MTQFTVELVYERRSFTVNCEHHECFTSRIQEFRAVRIWIHVTVECSNITKLVSDEISGALLTFLNMTYFVMGF